MTLPDPKPGLLVRYDTLWTHEAATGRDQGKNRPACLIAATDPTHRPRHVVLLPITHARPEGDTVGIEMPARVRQALGLDGPPNWVIVSEHNIDEWPGTYYPKVTKRPGVMGRASCVGNAGTPIKRLDPKAAHALTLLECNAVDRKV